MIKVLYLSPKITVSEINVMSFAEMRYWKKMEEFRWEIEKEANKRERRRLGLE